MGKHYNPFGVNHGPFWETKDKRHVGDLKQIEVGSDGKSTYFHIDNLASLFGTESIGGRGFVITEFADDAQSAIPSTNPTQSLIDGNAGKILACGEIIIDNGTDPKSIDD